MPFPVAMLNDGEEIVLDRKPHWIFVAPSFVVGGIVVAIAVAALANDINNIFQMAALILLALTALFILLRYLTWTSTNFVVTTDRVVFRAGIFAKRGMEIPLERVNNIATNQTIVERLLGAGDLVIESGGEDGKQVFYDVVRPFEVANLIHAERENAASRDRHDSGPRGGGGVGRTLSVPEQLEKLAALLQQGMLTPAEYEMQKSKILNS